MSLFKREIIKEEKDLLPEHNSQLIQQNASAIATKTSIYTSTSDPTVNDDIDLGYKIGDFWLNTTDAGLFVCCDNADGAADWDEITKT